MKLFLCSCALSLAFIFPACDAQSSAATIQPNCSDPVLAVSAVCRTANSAQQRTDDLNLDRNGTSLSNSDGQRQQEASPQLYVDSAGTDIRRRNPANRIQDFPPDPITDFQRLVHSSSGQYLPIFGRDLFQQAPSTFAPADQIPVTSDYVVGPGDQLLVRFSGPESFNSQLTVDTTGSIYIPKVGGIHVAGLRYEELQKEISAQVTRIYRNFSLSVSLGRLRSIQVYVIGEARQPGAYTISSLSTALNALFASGGPTIQGSLRGIQIQRDGQPNITLDLYDLILRGEKSKDVRLQQGDTIFIPSVGPQAALAGSVRHPAIFELRGETTIPELLQYAGGVSATAIADHIALERIDSDHTRKALTLSMSAEGHTLPLRDGDVLYVNHIGAGYEQSVTIRGNLANPGRFPWHPGMRLSEIIPDRKSLLTLDYWRERNRLGVPVPLFEPFPQNSKPGQASGLDAPGFTSQPRSNGAPDQDLNAEALRAAAQTLALQNSQLPSTSDANQAYLQNDRASDPTTASYSSSGDATMPGTAARAASNARLAAMQHKINIPTAEIDWSYAVVERLDSDTLKSVLLPFNLGKLVQDQDPSQNLELQPGDVVTILSQADIPVPLDEQTKFIRLEGEFASAGVYSVHPGESLEEIVRRAGGLSAKAYLYGSSFLRESARVFQQQRLDEYISALAADLERAAAVRAASSTTGIVDPNALAQQRNLVSQLRQLRATGRVVLEFQPSSAALDGIPKIALENGDVFRVPSRPSTVSVIGAVYGQNVFLFDPDRRLEDYVALAGKPNRIADRQHAFIIRADGSIYSRQRAQGIWKNNFDKAHIYPGDSIVVPEKPIKPTILRELIDYSQILSSFGLAAAAINVIR